MLFAQRARPEPGGESSQSGHTRYRGCSGVQGPEFLDKPEQTKDTATAVFLHTGLIGFDVEVGSFIVRPELLRLLKRGNNRDANQDDLALAV